MSQAETDARHRSAPSCSKHGSVNMTPARSPIAEATALVLRIGRAAMVHACEVGRMVSVAATVPYHLFGSRPDSEYIGLQPVPAHTAPTARPVLLVHGLGGTKSSWSHLAKTLSARGLTFAAVTYAPFGTSVERLADRLAVDVERMLSQTGADKVHLVGHSLSSPKRSLAVSWAGRSTRSSPSVHRLAVRHGRICCRSGPLSGRCGKIRHCCVDWPPRRHRTVFGGCPLRPPST